VVDEGVGVAAEPDCSGTVAVATVGSGAAVRGIAVVAASARGATGPVPASTRDAVHARTAP